MTESRSRAGRRLLLALLALVWCQALVFVSIRLIWGWLIEPAGLPPLDVGATLGVMLVIAVASAPRTATILNMTERVTDAVAGGTRLDDLLRGNRRIGSATYLFTVVTSLIVVFDVIAWALSRVL